MSSQPLSVKQELELRLVLAELTKAQSATDRRGNRRHLFQQKIGLLLTPVGSQASSSHIAIAKDLSDDGIGLLYNGTVIYPKTKCLVLLPSLHDGVMQVEGVVVRCRAVRHSIHEVGVRFSKLIELPKFIDLEGGSSADGAPSANGEGKPDASSQGQSPRLVG